MVSGKFRSAVVVVVVAGAVVLGGCVGNNPGTNGTASPSENATVSPGGNQTTNESGGVAATFKRRMSALDSYTATVTTHSTFGGNETTTKTNIWARPSTGQVRREVVSSPYNEGTVTVSNDSTILTYNPSSNSVTRVDRSNYQQGHSGSASLSMVDSVVNRMTVESLGTEQLDGEQTYHVRLKSNSSASMGTGNTNVTAWLDADTYFPVRVETHTSSGQMNFSSVVTYENVELNPTISDEKFTLDTPADANTSNITLPDSRVYDSRAALQANTSLAVPNPDVPADFNLRQARLTRGESPSVSLQYGNQSARVSVSRTDNSTYNSTNGETVQIGNQTGRYDSYGSAGMVIWTCHESRYMVSGTLSREKLLDIAASVDCS